MQPTEFYNEGWLTRLLIFSVTDAGLKDHDLFIDKNDKYFSESLLYSPFLPRSKKDDLAESFTHADGAIGQFEIGTPETKGALELKGNKLKIIEAKIYSKFSSGVTNASFYNQCARYMACITKTVEKSKFDELKLHFILTLPKEQYEKEESFKEVLEKTHIFETVSRRVEQYKNEDDYPQRKEWLNGSFKNILDKIKISHHFYEDILSELKNYEFYEKLDSYYKKCLEFNSNK